MRFGIDDRAPGFRIDAFGPCYGCKWLRGDKSTADAIKDIVEAVLVRLHDHFSLAPVYVQVGQNEALHTVKIPRVARRVLVVPLEVAGIDVDGENRAYIEVVFALRLTKLFRPWAAI